MSTNPSIVFYQGLRCTKVPRQPRATDSPSPSTEANTPSSTAETSAENAAPQTSLDQPTSNEDSTSITVFPITTTSSSYSGTDPSSSSQTTSQELESHSSELDIGIHSTASNSAPHTTFTTETYTTPQPSTSSQPVPSVSNSDSTEPPYATIFGALFGALGFIALVAVIIFLSRRRSRRSSGGLQDDRASTDSRTGLRRDFRSQMSYLSDAFPTSSINYKSGATDNFGKHQSQIPLRSSDPFSDMAEVPHEPTSTMPFIVQSSTTNPTRPAESHAANRESVHSGTSLGSTLILPGRSSVGSDFQRLSPSSPKPPTNGPSYSVWTANAQGDSFDLDNSQNVVSRRSSGTIPIALL